MKIFLAACCCIFFFSTQSLSQAPVISWYKTYGSENGDYVKSITKTSDGGYIAIGYTESNGGDVSGYHGNPVLNDFWVVKMDVAGNIQWQRCVGGPYFEQGVAVKETADGGYVVAGTAASVSCNMTKKGGVDYWLVKLNNKGDMLWEKSYGGSKNDYVYSIDITADGGYVLAGFTESTDKDITLNHGGRDFWIVKVNSGGDLQWQKSFGGTGEDEAFSIKSTNDGGYIVAGFTESNDADVSGNHGKSDYWVIKLAGDGSLQWQKSLGGSEREWAWAVELSADGGFAISGRAASNNGDVTGNHNAVGYNATDFWVVKLSSSGTLQWQKCYGGTRNEMAYGMKATSDGGYLIIGDAESFDGDLACNAGITDVWIIKISSTGVLQWKKSMGGNYYDTGFDIDELADGSYIVAATTCSKTVPGYHPNTNSNGTCADFWIIKLSAAGTAPPTGLKIDATTTTVCSGTSATIKAVASNMTAIPKYQWTKNGVPVGDNSPYYTASNFANNDQVTCTITSGDPCATGSVATDMAIITVNSSIIHPAINISSNLTTICECVPVIFRAAVTNAGTSPHYQWKINNANVGSNSPEYINVELKPGDVITCEYTDNTDCVANGFVVSNAIEIKNSGSSQFPSVKISTAPATFCEGSIINFTANAVDAGINPTYQWKVNGVNAGTNSSQFSSVALVNGDVVRCTIITDATSACSVGSNAAADEVKLQMLAKANPAITISIPTGNICEGSPVTFKASASNAGTNPTYQWKINGSVAGTNNNQFISSILNTGDIVSCELTIDPGFTCALSSGASSNNIEVMMQKPEVPSIQIEASVNDVCAGTNINFKAIVQNSVTTASYKWMLNNQPVGNNTPALSSKEFKNGDALYCMLVPAASSCMANPVVSNTIIAIIRDLPQVRIIPADTVISIGKQIQLKTIINGTISSHQWVPADKLQNALSLNPITNVMMENISYRITIESDKGCKAVATALIKVSRSVSMPNAFTPNADGNNDIFRITPGATLRLSDFSIFDRWGRKIFTTKEIIKGWDGTINGRSADAGSYIYTVKGTDEKGSVNIKGTVVLVR